MRRAVRVCGVIVWLAAAACSSSSTPSAPSTNVPFSATDLAVGTGPLVAASGNTATVQYSGWVYKPTAADNKGAQFDTGAFSFRIGSGQVIPGFDRGVVGMRAGGSRRVIIPPDLGYGNVAQSRIPANSTLVFDILLTALQ